MVLTRHPRFSEQPVAQALWLSVDPGSDTMTALTPALEAGLLHRLSDGGMLHLYGSGNWRWSPQAERLLRMRIGSVSARFYGVPTEYSQGRTRREDAPAVLAMCREDQVDVALIAAL